MPDDSSFARLEGKVDKLAEAIATLVRIDERQMAQASTLKELRAEIDAQDGRITDIEREVAKWVQRGIGLYAGLATLSAIVMAWLKYGGH